METLLESLRDPSRPVFLFGCTPPREGTSAEKARETCEKFTSRSAVLATDGFIVYDIQDESGRTGVERPFPFRKTIDSAEYAAYFRELSGKECVVYKCVVDDSPEKYLEWLDSSCRKYGHSAFNLVGAASSDHSYTGVTLHQAADMTRSRSGCGFGCVCIPERHTAKGNENHNMVRKIEFGAEWFITQGIFCTEAIIQLIHEYGDLCREKGITPKKLILTFAPCGRAKTMQFIKWLGMHVPEEVEQRIFAPNEHSCPVRESIQLHKENLIRILTETKRSGVPLGVNVESLSIYREEIDAAHDLFQILQVCL